MLKLSEFLEVPEGVEFKVNGFENKIYTIKDNTLMYKNAETNDNWHENYDFINLVVQAGKITIIPRSLLTDEEREYLKAVIEPYKDKGIVIAKAFNAIMIYSKNELKQINIMWVRFECTKEMQFKGLKELEEYALVDLGLEE